MSQNFAHSGKTGNLSVAEVAQWSDEEAYAVLKAIRFEKNDGEPYCPKCGCITCYTYQRRPLFKCKQCEHQFTLTSGTILSCCKLPIRKIFIAIILFVNGGNGHSSIGLSKNIGCSPDTASVLLHKLREALVLVRPQRKLTGHVEIDGCYVGGRVNPANAKNGKGTFENCLHPKKQMIVTMRERGRDGKSISLVLNGVTEAIRSIVEHVEPEAKVRVDLGNWGQLYSYFRNVKTVNHRKAHWNGDVHTNCAEGFYSRVKAARAVRNLQAYADELAWRSNVRHTDSSAKFEGIIRAALKAGVSAKLG